MLKLAYASLDEVPESVRGICIAENGVVSLDDTKLKTQSDVDAVLEGKRKEVSDHTATKAKLSAWQKLGDSPETVQSRLNDLESRAGNSNEQTERIAALQRDKNKLSGELDDIKVKLGKIEPEYTQMKKQIHEAKTMDVLEKSVAKLQGVDIKRLTSLLRRDVAMGAVYLDESETGLAVKGGESFNSYAMTQADLFNFKLNNTPGHSNPGSEKIPQNIPISGSILPEVGFFSAEETKLLEQ